MELTIECRIKIRVAITIYHNVLHNNADIRCTNSMPTSVLRSNTQQPFPRTEQMLQYNQSVRVVVVKYTAGLSIAEDRFNQ